MSGHRIIRGPEAFADRKQKRPRSKDQNHLAYIRSLPCLICMTEKKIEAAHIRMADRRLGKRETGMAEKSDDDFTLPLCADHHADQHKHNESQWWADRGIDPVVIANALWRVTGNYEIGRDIIRQNSPATLVQT